MITHTRRHGDHGSRCQGATETGSIGLPRCLPTSRGGKWNCAPANRSEGEISQTSWIGHQVPSACGIVRAWDNMTRNVEMGPRKADPHPYSTYEDPLAYGTPERFYSSNLHSLHPWTFFLMDGALCRKGSQTRIECAYHGNRPWYNDYTS